MWRIGSRVGVYAFDAAIAVTFISIGYSCLASSWCDTAGRERRNARQCYRGWRRAMVCAALRFVGMPPLYEFKSHVVREALINLRKRRRMRIYSV